MRAPTTTTAVPFEKMTAADQTIELFYRHATELVKVAFLAINRAYPVESRKTNPKTNYRYEEAHGLAKQHRNFHKKKISEFTLGLCRVKRHVREYDAEGDQPTNQFRRFYMGQLELLFDKLVDYADLLIPAEDVDSFIRSLTKVYEAAKSGLSADLGPYEVDPLIDPKALEEQYGLQKAIDKKSGKPVADIMVPGTFKRK